MTWGEAYRLTQHLASDPASRVGAALGDLSFPASREAVILMDLFDLTHQIAWGQGGGKGGKPKPYPRPWRDKTRRRVKPSESLTQADIIAALQMAGHTAPLPTRASEN